jgi:hypothetical protein
MTWFRPPERVQSAQAQAPVPDRGRRRVAATDPRVRRRLWSAPPDGAQRPLCPGCGAVLRDGTLVPRNQTTRTSPTRQAFAAGDPGAPTPERPLRPGELWCGELWCGELWCVVCLPRPEERARTPSARGFPERLHALVEVALRGE